MNHTLKSLFAGAVCFPLTAWGASLSHDIAPISNGIAPISPTLSAVDTVAPVGNHIDTAATVRLDEVVVVSQPKETRLLRELPISSTTLTGDRIQHLGDGSLQSLSQFVPSTAMPHYGSRLTSSIYIRGLGARTGYSPIAMYVDGMPIVNRSAHNFHLYEVARVDVLRGPQGTLYGQNAEGGLMRVYTQSARNQRGTHLRLNAGNGRYTLGEIAHYTPLGSKWQLAVAAFAKGQRGFAKNTNLHQYADSAAEVGGRLRLTFQPTSNIDIDYVADYQYSRENAFPYGLVSQQGDYAQLPSTTFMSTYRRHLLRTGINIALRTDRLHLYSNTSYQHLNDRMLMDQDYVAADFFSLRQNQLHHALTEEVVVRSPDGGNGTGKADRRYRWLFGLFGSYQWLKTDAPVQFGDGITTPISAGIRGAMYNAILQQMKQAFIARGMSDEQATQAARQLIEERGGITTSTTMDTPGHFRTPEANAAIYHESSLALTPRLLLTAGLRYDYSHQQLRYDTHSAMAMTANVMGSEATYTLTSLLRNTASTHAHQLLPKFAVSFFTDRQRHGNVYAQVSKGYRAGGYNLQMFSDVLRKELNDHSAEAMHGSVDVEHTAADYQAIVKTISYKPEVSWNYEVGTHQRFLLGSRSQDVLNVNAGVFFMQVRNQQLSLMAGNYGYGRRMVNAGRTHSSGLELHADGTALEGRLTWMANYSYTHAVFRRYSDVVSTADGELAVDYRGNHVPFAPQHSLSAAAEYQWQLPKAYRVRILSFGIDTHMQGKTYWNEANTQYQKLYALLGTHIGVQLNGIALTLWSRNITDTRYHTFLVESSATGQSLSFAQRGNPRQVGVDLQMRF